MRPSRLVVAFVLAATSMLVPSAGRAQAFEYAVKVVCGNPERFTVPGRFATVINVHNPSSDSTRFRAKVAVAATVQGGGLITRFGSFRLRSDGALAITCRQVQAMANDANVDGFVVIQSPIDLDVVAVYSAAGNAGVTTMDVERVPPRRMRQ